MHFERYLLNRIAFSTERSFSRFIITIAIIAVALSVAVMIISTSLMNGFQKEISSKVFGFWAHIQVVPYSLNRSFIEEPVYKFQDFYVTQDSIDGVRHIQVTATKGGIIKTKDDFEGIILKGVGSDFDWEFMDKYIVDGSIIQTSDTTISKGIIVSQLTANFLKLKTGDKVIISFLDKRIRMRPFYISGIYNTGLAEFDRQYAFVDLAFIQDFNDWGKDSVGGFEIFLTDISRLDEMGEYFYFHLTNPQLTAQTIKELFPNIFDWLKLQSYNEVIILILMFIVAVINMITALLILILERTQMIGILKTLGTDNWSIRKLFLYHAMYIVGLGLLFGNFFGIGICWLQQQFHFIKLPEESYYVSVAPVDINFWWILGLNAATIILCLLVLIIPTYLVTRITPLKAIRFA